MDASRFQLVKRLLADALEHPPAEQVACLRRACGEDTDLFAQVLAFLRGPDAGSTALADQLTPDPEPPENLTGMRLGAWRLVRALGRGGMGTVWLAERDDASFEMFAAVKLVSKAHRRPRMIGRFRRERQILAHLKHPHIAGLIDGGTTTDGRPYLVMEYVDGEVLDAWCRRRAPAPPERVALVGRICSALAHAHGMGIIHRDIKCSNIMVTSGGHAKLMDFGIARLIDVGGPRGLHLTHSGELLMTPEYAAPELLRGDEATVQSDLYALGLVLLQILTDRPAGALLPYLRSHGGTGSEVFCDADGRPLPDALIALLQRALADDADARFASAEAMGEALTGVLDADADPAGLRSVVHVPGAGRLAPPHAAEEVTELRRRARAWQESDYDPRLLPRGRTLARMRGHAAWCAPGGLEQRFVAEAFAARRDRLRTRGAGRGQAHAPGGIRVRARGAVGLALGVLLVLWLVGLGLRHGARPSRAGPELLPDSGALSLLVTGAPDDLLETAAAETARAARAAGPDGGPLWLALGRLHARLGAQGTAREHFRRALGLTAVTADPALHVAALTGVAQTHLAESMPRAACDLMDDGPVSARLQGPEGAPLARVLGEAFYRLGEREQGRRLLDAALQTYTRDGRDVAAADCRTLLALCDLAEEKWGSADAGLVAALAARRAAWGRRHPATVTDLARLAVLHRLAGATATAADYAGQYGDLLPRLSPGMRRLVGAGLEADADFCAAAARPDAARALRAEAAAIVPARAQ